MAKSNYKIFNEEMLKRGFKSAIDNPLEFVVWMAGREYQRQIQKEKEGKDV